jgi:hypothetical protein
MFQPFLFFLLLMQVRFQSLTEYGNFLGTTCSMLKSPSRIRSRGNRNNSQVRPTQTNGTAPGIYTLLRVMKGWEDLQEQHRPVERDWRRTEVEQSLHWPWTYLYTPKP